MAEADPGALDSLDPDNENDRIIDYDNEISLTDENITPVIPTPLHHIPDGYGTISERSSAAEKSNRNSSASGSTLVIDNDNVIDPDDDGKGTSMQPPNTEPPDRQGFSSTSSNSV